MSMTPSASTIASVGIGIPVATLGAWIVNICCQVEMPGEVQAALGALISAGIGYFFNGGRSLDTTVGTDNAVVAAMKDNENGV